MENIKTILVDDERSGINTLHQLLEEYCPEVEIIATCSDADSAKEKIENLHPQLVFLDISMPLKTGFDLLAELDTINFEIIFVTAHNQYAIQAFRYSAVDYLVKPVDEDLLIDAVKRAVKRIKANSNEYTLNTLLHNIRSAQSPAEMKLCISSLKGFSVVHLKDILYCEASGSYTNLYFVNGTVSCSTKPIYQYEEILADAGFIRVHKSFLVNIIHIDGYQRGEGGFVILSDGKNIEVSRRKREELMGVMKKFYKY